MHFLASVAGLASVPIFSYQVPNTVTLVYEY
jgi:hypothetical protein